MIKIEIPKFDERNHHKIKHVFLCNVPIDDRLNQTLDTYFHSNLQANDYVFPEQVHSNICIFTRNPSINSLECDAIVTDRANLTLVIKTADCVPILLSDPVNNIIGVAHAGWKGIRLGIIQNTIAKMIDIGSEVKHTSVAIGPCILRENYEVQEDLLKAFGNTKNRFHKSEQGKYYFDLLEHCKDILVSEGIRKIYDSGVDTYSNREIASYRRAKHLEHSDKYRNISAIVMRKDYAQDQKTDCSNRNKEWDNFVQRLKQVPDRFACFPHDKEEHSQLAITGEYEELYDDQEYLDMEVGRRKTLLNSQESRIMLQKVHRGKIRLEESLDLHWETEESAYRKTINFVLESYELGLRYLLIIVGKGKNNDGKIKGSLAFWLKNHRKIRELLMLVEEALPQHGGEGAYYVFLKRKR